MLPLQSLWASLSVKDSIGTKLLLKRVEKEIGISIKNNPTRVQEFRASVGLNKGNWCACFVRWGLDRSMYAKFPIRSGVANAYKTRYTIKAKDVLTGKAKVGQGWLVIWKNKGSWTGHIGYVIDWDKMYGSTIEGNTSDNDTRQGGNVEKKRRKIDIFNSFSIVAFTPVYKW